jgi:hypothetical protein
MFVGEPSADFSQERNACIVGGQVATDGGDGICSTNSMSIGPMPSDNSIDRL